MSITLAEIIDDVIDVMTDEGFRTAETKAAGTITLSGLPSLDETITIGQDTWTFVELRSEAGEITLGADADACVTNIAAGINADSSIVTAVASTTADTVVVTAVNGGISWSSLPFTESASNLTMNGSGYLGGTTAGSWGTRVRRAVNRTLRRVAGSWRDERGGLREVLLPGLAASSVVTTVLSQDYTAMPTDFMKRAWWVYSTTHSRTVTMYGSNALMRAALGSSAVDTAGAVKAVAVEGKKLVYQDIPATAESLRVHYFSLPDELVYMDDAVTVLPDHLERDLLVYGTCASLMHQVEDGMDGRQINTDRYNLLFNQAMWELIDFLGPPALGGKSLNVDQPFDLDNYSNEPEWAG